MAEKIQIGELVYKVSGDASGLKAALKNVEVVADNSGKKVDKSFGSRLKGMFVAVGAAAAASKIFSFFKNTVKAASDAEETANKFGVVYRNVAGTANKAAEDIARSFGVSRQESKKFLSDTGDLLTGFGFTQEAALKLSDQVTKLGLDLSSFANVSQDYAVEGLRKALLGETEQAKGLGIVINQTTKEFRDAVKQKQTSEKVTLQQAKAMVILEQATAQSKNAIGDFARSQDSFNNVTKRVNSLLKDQSVDIGDKLTPALSNLGIAFLSASKDGGALQNVLGSISKTVAYVINTIAKLTVALDTMGPAKNLELITEEQEKALSSQKKIIAAAKEAGFQNLSQLKTAAKTNEQAKIYLDLYNKVEARRIKLQGLGNKEQDTLSDKLKAVDAINDRIEKEKQLIEKAIAKREKERKGIKTVTGDISKANKEYQDFQRWFVGMSLGNVGKIEAERDAKLEALKKYHTAGIIGEKEFQAKRAEIAKHYNNLITQEQIKTVIEYTSAATNTITDVLSSASALVDALTERRLENLEREKEAELEALGLSQETEVEKAEAELAEAERVGDAKTIKEKKDVLDRVKIDEKYAKEKAIIEYKGALIAWQLQQAMAVAQAPLAVLNAISAGWKFGPVVAGIYGGLATVAAGLQIAAVAASKPQPPKFAEGGIVPGGSYSGDRVPVMANSGEMVLNQAQQKQLFDVANGGGGMGTTVNLILDNTLIGKVFYRLSQNGDLMIDSAAVI